MPPGHGVEAAELVDRTICCDAQNAGVVGARVDDVANGHASGEWRITGRDRSPLTGRAPTQRAPVDDSERTAISVGRERANGVAGELLLAALLGKDEQPITPRRYEYRWSRHAPRR